MATTPGSKGAAPEEEDIVDGIESVKHNYDMKLNESIYNKYHQHT